MSIYDLMSIGNNAMMNAKLGINVTSNNIANADTKGYARNTVNYAARRPIQRGSLMYGTGADAVSLDRHYNYFVEQQFLASKGQEQFWNAKAETLYSVESLFKQGDKDYGLSAALGKYFSSWNALTQDADSSAYRMELKEYSNTLATMLHTMDASLQQEMQATNKSIELAVNDANQLMKDVAELNKALMSSPDNMVLQDERDRKIRSLGELLPIKSLHQSDGTFTVVTEGGQTLVDGVEAFELVQKGPEATPNLTPGSAFDGSIQFEGQGSKELKVEIITGGKVGTAEFRVSTDGGKSWLTDADGSVRTFTTGEIDNKVMIDGVGVYFEKGTDKDLVVGDSFNIVPKDGLYWKKTTAHLVNITPLGGYGNESGRLSGGRIGGLLAARDSGIVSYREQMDAFTKELIWQTNYQHSQGAGLEHYAETTSSNSVLNPDTAPLNQSNLPYAQKITNGTLSFQTYSAQGAPVDRIEITVTPAMTLKQLADEINDTPTGDPKMEATIEGGKLSLKSRTTDGTFEFAGDTSGALAALGLNTYFSGSRSSDIELEARIKNDPKRINAAVVNGLGLVNSGDNTNALALHNIVDTSVTLDSIHSSTSATFSTHLSALTALVGADMDGASRNKVYNAAVNEDLEKRQQSEAGVNMDEELTNLTKYQNSFDAASKLITTANEMFDTILRLKS